MKNLLNNNNFNLNSKYIFKSLQIRGRSIRDIMTEIQSYENEESYLNEVKGF